MLESDNWHKLLKQTIGRVSIHFNKIIQSMTAKKVNKSKAETEADNTREEMLKWANQVSSGRIVNNPFDSVLNQAIEDIENSEPSI